ncbi:hypothetical protein ACVWWR_007868 [Bradyrhizobium sp. LM3.2]
MAVAERFAQDLPRRSNVGRMQPSAVSAKAFTVASSRITKSSTLRRKFGSEAALRNISGPTPVSARNRPSRSGSPATKDSA